MTNQNTKYGLWGTVTALVGCGLAILIIPEDHSRAGALFSSAVIMTAALAAVPIIRRRSDYRTIFRAEHVMMFAFIYWILLDMLQSAYDLPVPREVVVSVFLAIGLASAGIWMGSNVGAWSTPAFLKREGATIWNPDALFAAVILSFVIGVWDFLYRSDFDLGLIANSLVGRSRFDSPWQRAKFGDWSAFSYHLQYFGYIVPALVVMHAARRGWFDWRTVIGLALSLIILLFHIQGGGRRIVGGIIVIALICWLLPQRRMMVRNVFPTVLLVACLVLGLQLMLLVRDTGLGYGIGESSFDYVHVDDNFLRLAQTIELVPEYIPFVNFQFLFYILVRPIPRALWPDKPESGGFDLANILNPADTETTYTMSMIGEWYITWGLAMVFMGGWFYGRLGSVVNGVLEDERFLRNPLIAAIGLVILLIGVRSLIELVLMSYPLIAWMIVASSLRFWQRATAVVRTAA